VCGTSKNLSCYTGIEVAAALVGKAKTVTVVGLEEVPFQLVLGKEVGTAVRKVCCYHCCCYNC